MSGYSMPRYDQSRRAPNSRRQRTGIILVVALLHVALALALVHGLAGGVIALITPPDTLDAAAVTLDTARPTPPPVQRPPARSNRPAGDAGASGRKASAMQVMAPPARIVLPAPPAAPVAGEGDARQSGAALAGDGTGGGLAGSGPGSGGAGSGDGAGIAARKAVKIAGDIAATHDYPAAGRNARAGRQVVIMLRIDTDGRVSDCRVHQPSGNDEADALTCRLARQRFRFRPATDAAGRPVASDYGWQQRWWTPPARSAAGTQPM
jgi:periplasmic protein TonB